jgi:hypothetical protein
MASKEYIVCTWKLPKYTSRSGFDGTTGADLAVTVAVGLGCVATGAWSREQPVKSATVTMQHAGIFTATCMEVLPRFL